MMEVGVLSSLLRMFGKDKHGCLFMEGMGEEGSGYASVTRCGLTSSLRNRLAHSRNLAGDSLV